MYKLEMRWDTESPWEETPAGDEQGTTSWDNAEDAYHAFVSTVELWSKMRWTAIAYRMVECHSDGTRLAVVAILDLGRLEAVR